jgi:rRNA maturation protein Nop10
MTYRVCDRGTGREYVGVRIVTVEVAAECPRCGGPRGEAVPSRFPEDGDWYVVDRWKNACGHIDSYSAVLAEYRKRMAELEHAEQRDAARAAAAAPVDAGEFTDAVAWLNMAAAEVRGLHAKQAAQFLHQQGYAKAAHRIQEELRTRHGRMSARQAAVFLADAGTGSAGGDR